jgi:hypothetical protein
MKMPRFFFAPLIVSFMMCTSALTADSDTSDAIGLSRNFVYLQGEEVQKGAYIIISHRAEIISNLRDTLREAKSERSKAYACFVLGTYRAREAVDEMLLNIELNYQVPRSEIRGAPPWFFYPCMEALIDVGNEAIPAVVEHLGVTDKREVARLCLDVLVKVDGPEITQTRLTQQMGKVSEEKRKRLEQALHQLGKR